MFVNLQIRADLWCSGYYPGWEQGSMPASTIDFTVITHLIHFSVVPNANGTLDTSVNSISLANSSDAVSKAHAAGRKVLISVGGGNSQAGFQGAASAANRSAFVSNLVNFMSSRGYDGIDIDWEPLDPADANLFTNFIFSLRSALTAVSPARLLTAAIASPPTPVVMLAQIQSQFDQINLMTYDLSGPYPGWITWFNAPIYDGGTRFTSTGGLVPSADGMIRSLTSAGVPSGKISIGIAFYGVIWNGGMGTSTGGATSPRQSWTTAPTTSAASYNIIVASYFQTNSYRWDNNAQAAYLTIDDTGSTNDRFVSYDDDRACQAKISYARNNQLGGVMIWELAQDHQPNQADPLLTAIKRALSTPGSLSIARAGSNIDLAFMATPLGSYRVQWTSNLVSSVWNTLVITNASGPEGPLHVVDANPPGTIWRFYRIQTPP